MMRVSGLSVVACLLAGSSVAWAQSATPTITPGGVVNAADYTAAVAPGMNVAVFGDSMASKVSSAAATPLPTVLDGTSVEVNGQAIPLFFISPKQINAQMPFGVSGQVQVRVRTAVGLSTPATVTVVASAPRLFTKTMDGEGEPILVHNSDWSMVSAVSPARPGEYLILFLTGLGAVSPAIPAGQAGGDNDKNGPLNQLPAGAVTVAFGGKQVAILFAGLAPTFVGLYQINLQVPADMVRGTFALAVSTKDGASQAGVLATADGAVSPSAPTTNLEFVFIPQGDFMMGCSPGATCASDQKPLHKVQITKPFEMGKYEVTQGQWQAVMGSNPSHFTGNDRPVEGVGYYDAQDFLRTLNARNDGYRYRLPTEAEWEYAARAGTTGPSYGDLDAIAWLAGNSAGQTYPVGQKAPNAWGLHDMLGNVWEMCQDWYDGNYYAQSPAADPPGGAPDLGKTIRGGGWSNFGTPSVSVRAVQFLGGGSSIYGFRCVRELWTAGTVALNSVTLPVTSVVGGNPVTGTVTLTTGALAGGALVTLTSNQTNAKVPASLTVSAGQASATFTITTNAVTSSAAVDITASLGLSSQMVRLTVNPPAQTLPDLAITSVTFPTSALVGSTQTFAAVVRNNGAAAAAAFRVGLYYSTDSTITTGDTMVGTCNISSLAAGSSMTCSGPLTVPTGLSAGTYWGGAIADDLNQVAESNKSNNALATTSTVSVVGQPSVNFTGTFSGKATEVTNTSVTGSPGASGPMSLVLTQTGTSISGYGTTFYANDHAVIPVLVDGRVNGATLTLTLTGNTGSCPILFTHSVTAATSASISGTYIKRGGCDDNTVTGTFAVTRQ